MKIRKGRFALQQAPGEPAVYCRRPVPGEWSISSDETQTCFEPGCWLFPIGDQHSTPFNLSRFQFCVNVEGLIQRKFCHLRADVPIPCHSDDLCQFNP